MTDIVDLGEWKKSKEESESCPDGLDPNYWEEITKALAKEQMAVFHAGGSVHTYATGLLTLLAAFAVLQPNSDRALNLISSLLESNQRIVSAVTDFSDRLRNHIENIEKARQAGIWKGVKGHGPEDGGQGD
jgi:hypothetical protein